MSAPAFHPRRLRHLPFGWWASTVILATSAALLTGLAIERADAAADRLGGLTLVPVAATDLAAGSLLGASDVKFIDWPRSLLPSSPPAPVPIGSRLTTPVFEGEPIVVGKVAPAGHSAVAALLGPNDRAIDIPVRDVTPNVEVGDNVELITPGPAPEQAIPGKVVATNERATTISIHREDVALIAEAIRSDHLTIVVTL